MKTIVYLRVSTKDQTDRGYSIPTQLRDCETYATRNGMEVVKVYTEDESGLILERSELSKVRRDFRQGVAAALLVHESDRLTRVPAHSILLRDELEGQGIGLHYALRGQVHFDDMGHQISEDIRARFAREEVKKIVERTSRGKRGKVEKGFVIVAQRPPYGYATIDGKLTIIEAEADVVRLIFRLYLQGWSVRKISAHLSEKRIPSPADSNGKMYKVRAYGVWSKTLVRNILSRETYTGVWYWGKTTRRYTLTPNGQRHVVISPAPRENWIPVEVPAIIDTATFEAAQKQIEYNIKMSSRATKREYLMAKRLNCTCGAAVYAEAKHVAGKVFLYYFCSSRHSGSTVPPCGTPYFRVERVDAGAWQYVKELLTDPNRMLHLIETYLAEMKETAFNPAAEIAERQVKIFEAERALERLARLYIRGQQDEAVFNKLRAELDTEIATLRSEIEELSPLVMAGNRDDLMELAGVIREYEAILLRQDEPFEIRKAWVDAFDLRGTLWIGSERPKLTLYWDLGVLTLLIGTPLPRKSNHNWQVSYTIDLTNAIEAY